MGESVSDFRGGKGDDKMAGALIVENDSVLRESLQALVQAQGFAVETAADLRDAISILEGGFTPDCLVLGCLNDDGGPEVYDAILTLNPGLTTFLIGSALSPEEPHPLSDAPGVVHLRLPFEPLELIAHLQPLMENPNDIAQ